MYWILLLEQTAAAVYPSYPIVAMLSLFFRVEMKWRPVLEGFTFNPQNSPD